MRLTDDHKQRNTGEQRAPRHRAQRILNTIAGARRRPEDEQLHVVKNERDDLQETGSSAGQTLKNDVTGDENQ